jgi:hypothetical protein
MSAEERRACMANVRQWGCEMALMARRQMLRQWFLLCALLLATGTLAQAAEPGVTILNENVSWSDSYPQRHESRSEEETR